MTDKHYKVFGCATSVGNGCPPPFAARNFSSTSANHPALGRAYGLCGSPGFAVRQCELAIALAPRDPHMRFHWQVGARALINKRDYHKASEWARKAIECDPTQARPYLLLAIALGYLGRRDEARVALDTADRVVPGYSGRWREWSEYRNPADQEHMRAGLAGLKEQ